MIDNNQFISYNYTSFKNTQIYSISIARNMKDELRKKKDNYGDFLTTCEKSNLTCALRALGS